MATDLNRRSFLQLAGSAAAILSVSSLSSGAAENAASSGAKRSIKKGIMYGTIGLPGSVMEKFRAVKEAGFDGVEPNSHMDQNEVLEARDAHGLQTPSVCCSTHWGQPLSDPNPAVREKGLKGLE